MAIGLAETLGFHFKENFNLPYCSSSIREFWRRWHISLSTWFRDYLYIPLGGNRKGTVRTYINLIIVFFATGLWHGAQWNFVIWGLYHGLFLILERVLPPKKRAGSILSRICTMLIVCIGWVFFRADDLAMAGAQLRQMVSFSSTGSWNFSEVVDPITLTVFVLSLLLSLGAGQTIYQRIQSRNNTTAEVLGNLTAVILLFLSLVMLANAAHNPFIYFRF